MIDLAPHWLEEIRTILRTHAPDYEVRAFGSRVTGGAQPYSDLDLAMFGPTPLSFETRCALEHAFSESNLPICVDVVDGRLLASEMWKAIQETGDILIA